MSKLKSQIIFNSTDETQCTHLASWLSKASKNAKCTMKKRTRKRGVDYIVTLRYSPTIRPMSMFRIGQLFAEYVGLMSYRAFKLLPGKAEQKYISLHTESEAMDDLRSNTIPTIYPESILNEVPPDEEKESCYYCECTASVHSLCFRDGVKEYLPTCLDHAT